MITFKTLKNDFRHCYGFMRYCKKNLTKKEWNHLISLEYVITQGYGTRESLQECEKELDRLRDIKYSDCSRLKKIRLFAENLWYGTGSFIRTNKNRIKSN
jgi:hypothetical protein